MAISTDTAIHFFGTQTTVTAGGGTAAVTDNSFSITADIVQFTNFDDAPLASVTAFFDWNTTSPNANTVINLYARLMNTDGTNDADVPDANFQHIYVGGFPINDVLTNQFITIDIPLPNTKTSQIYEFYIENKTGQTLVAGWTLKVTPKTIGPAA